MKLLTSFPRATAVLAFALPLSACQGTTTAFGGPSQANPLDSEESSVIQSLNMLRMGKGLPQVAVCFSLNVSASAHSDDMRNKMYLSDVSPDGSTVRTRGCMNGYTPACTGMIPMAELVAEGFGTGAETLSQWAADPTAGPILIEAPFVVAGCGRSIGADNERWTLDLASQQDASCNQ
jgi:uncharacterized protein YkwD